MKKQVTLGLYLISALALILGPATVSAQGKWRNVLTTVDNVISITKEKADGPIDIITKSTGSGTGSQPTRTTSQSSGGRSRTSSSAPSQPEAYPRQGTPAVKSPNQALKGATISSFNPKIQFVLDSCKGDRSSQVVTIYFKAKHQMPNQNLTIEVSDNRTQAYDSEGVSRKAQAATIAGSRARWTVVERLPTNINIPCTIEIANIVDFKNPSLQSVFIRCHSEDTNGGANGVYGEIEINNLPIDWQ